MMRRMAERETRARRLESEVKKEIADLHLVMAYGTPQQKARARTTLGELEAIMAKRLRVAKNGDAP